MKPSATSSAERPSPISCASFGKRLAHRVGVERKVLLRPENLREEIRDELADHHVGVGDRKRPAAAVACRSRIGAGAVRADAKARAVEMQDRAAAGRHRVDQHHRRAHAHAGDLGLERALVLAVEMRHVGRGAAHVEADQPVEARFASGLRHADHAARRSRQDRVLALEQLGGGEPARRHHEHQAGGVARSGNAAAHLLRHLRHVAADDRRQISVDHRRVAAADQLDQRRDLVADRHLREAELARERRHLLLMRRDSDRHA